MRVGCANRADLYPLQMLLFAVSGWVNRHQQDMIAYLVEENRVLQEQLTRAVPGTVDTL